MKSIVDDTRGQVMGPPPGFGILLTLVVVALMVVVGKEMLATVGVQMGSDITCLGLWGCGVPSVAEVAPAVFMLLVVGGVIVMGVRGWLPRP